MKIAILLSIYILLCAEILIAGNAANTDACARAEKQGAPVVWVQPKFLAAKCYIEVDANNQVIRMDAEDWLQYFGEGVEK